MKVKKAMKFKGIIHAFVFVFIILWICCFFYSAVKLIVQDINYRGHSIGEVIKIEEWMGWNDNAEAYNFNIISYRYQTEDGKSVIGKENTNSRKTGSDDRFVAEIKELNPEIKVGAQQELLYNLNNPEKVVSEYYRKNQETFCLLTGLSSAIILLIIFIIFRIKRQLSKSKQNR